jgi:hypothetical protein
MVADADIFNQTLLQKYLQDIYIIEGRLEIRMERALLSNSASFHFSFTFTF